MYRFVYQRWLFMLVLAGYSLASNDARAGEFTDWQTGDLMVHRASCVGWAEATCDPRTGLLHAGIVRMTGGGPYVVEASGRDGVFEIPVDEFISYGRQGRFAVLRLRGMDERLRHVPPDRAWDFIHAPYDPLYMSSHNALYAAELIAVAFASIDVQLGEHRSLSELTIASVSPSAFDSDAAPECSEAALSNDECLALMSGRQVITLESIVSDTRLSLIYSSLPELMQ